MTTPRMQYFATKSKARSEPLWIGCQKLVVRAANSS